MSKPMRRSPRAPMDAYGRTVSGASGARSRARRMVLTAAARSGAVSANVPSKSKSTARLVTHAAQEIVDVAVAPEPVLARERVVGHADELDREQARFARVARQLGRLDEAQVVVRAARKEAKDVFGADHGEEIRLRVAVDGGEEDLAAGPHEARAGGDDARRLRHVLEEFHAGDDVEGTGMTLGVVLGADALVGDRGVALQQVQLRDAQRLVGEIGARDARAARRHRLGEDAAAAAHIEHTLAREPDALVDPVEAQRIDLVQRTDLALRVPPAMRELAEFLEYRRVGVHRAIVPKKSPAKAGLLSRAARLLRVGG